MSFILLPTFASSEEIYKFERMWPTLQQPWYFYDVKGIATYENGTVYVVDSKSHRIQKFSSNGQLITAWGQYGSEDGDFDAPEGVTLDANENVYVVDTNNHRIQKFSANGVFIAKWGCYGSEDGNFASPKGIATDRSNNIYVVDSGNYCVQKFNSDGLFITKWGSIGFNNGEFLNPGGIAVGRDGYVYVSDYDNACVQKFTSDGEFVTKWGSEGNGDEEFRNPAGIAVNGKGNIYVVDKWNHCIKKFTTDGQFIDKWFHIQAFEDGGIGIPETIAIDTNGNVYVADQWNQRIQKFNSNGQFIAKWGDYGSELFHNPEGIAVDQNGCFYITDRNLIGCCHGIKKFSSDGSLICSWGGCGSLDGTLDMPSGIAIDGGGNVYVVDTNKHRIQKYNSDGLFITKWGSEGQRDGEFDSPRGIAIDEGNNIYVADSENHRIQKFNSNGQFLIKWGSIGSENGQFNLPLGIALDARGNVYVADSYNYRIQKFTSDGNFITEFGEFGCDPGCLHIPSFLCVSPTGRVYVSDSANDRIQVFKKVEINPNTKAIIVAGGGSYQSNNLWDATQMCANFAYRALTYQGFSKETIYYLTSDSNLDLDSNGEFDDVDGDATNSDLQEAITSWAADADSLVVYLVDHGGSGTFRMSSTETLFASNLDSWLDSLQATISGKVIVIYDACESGSFLSSLTPSSEKERIVITSTSPGESAYFLTQGSISFSNYFWTHIFNGLNIKDAFDLAESALSYSFEDQHLLLDANGNTVGNEPEDFLLTQNIYVGNGTVIHGDAPIIGSVFADEIIESASSALLCAINVTDNDGIARVWAVIRHPDYRQGASNNPVQELPSIDLVPVGADRYESSYNGFNIEGIYQIAIYARDRIGNTSIPKLTTVTVENPLRRKAIIVVGGTQSDDVWSALEKSATLAYEALTFQGYSDDDIYFMSSVTFSTGVDGLSTLSNLSYTITTWAQQSTQDVVLYLLGNGDEGTFQINEAETLSAANLDTWLDNLQGNISGKVTVIYDAYCSGSFLQFLMPPTGKKRTVLTSTGNDQPAYFLSEGDISFSKYFWSRVLNGANIRDSFLHAKKAFLLLCEAQTPHLDDNGNGIGNEKSDGILARNYTIGVGIMLAGDDPLIGSVSPEQTLNGQISATIWAKDVTTTGTIDRVWAVILPPGADENLPGVSVTDLPSIELVYNSGLNRYEGTYNGFSTYGTYGIAICAKDMEGRVSLPMTTSVNQEVGFIIGDINGDWNVDMTDAIIALKVLAGMDAAGMISIDYATSGTDVNGDNKIGMEEVVYVIQKMSGLRD